MIVGLRDMLLERVRVWVMRVRATFKRLIPHLSACCTVGLDGEIAGRQGAVSQAPGFLTSTAEQLKRPYAARLASLWGSGDLRSTD